MDRVYRLTSRRLQQIEQENDQLHLQLKAAKQYNEAQQDVLEDLIQSKKDCEDRGEQLSAEVHRLQEQQNDCKMYYPVRRRR